MQNPEVVHNREVLGLREELVNLAQSYLIYRYANLKKVETYDNALVDFWNEKQRDIDPDSIEKINRGTEMMMIWDFAVSLGEQKQKQYFPFKNFRCNIELVSDEDAVDKNEFIFSTNYKTRWFKKHLWVEADAGTLFSEKELYAGSLAELPPVLETVSNHEFVFLLISGLEEREHMMYFMQKKRRELNREGETWLAIKEESMLLEDKDQAKIIYHTSDSEYRGLVAKCWFLHNYLPSFHADSYRWKREAGKIRKQSTIERDQLKRRGCLSVIQSLPKILYERITQ